MWFSDPRRSRRCLVRAQATETAEASAGVDSDEQPLHTTMDFRVGRIIEVADHPDADSLVSRTAARVACPFSPPGRR